MTQWNVFVICEDGDLRKRELLTTVEVSSELASSHFDAEDEETEARFLGEQFLGESGHLAYPGFKRLSVEQVRA